MTATINEWLASTFCLYYFMCIGKCLHVHMWPGVCRGQEGTSGPLQLELQMLWAPTCWDWTWVLHRSCQWQCHFSSSRLVNLPVRSKWTHWAQKHIFGIILFLTSSTLPGLIFQCGSALKSPLCWVWASSPCSVLALVIPYLKCVGKSGSSLLGIQ